MKYRAFGRMGSFSDLLQAHMLFIDKTTAF
jgi:hypothetical protein